MFGVINCRKFLIGIHDYKGLNKVVQKRYRYRNLLATEPLPSILCCLIKYSCFFLQCRVIDNVESIYMYMYTVGNIMELADVLWLKYCLHGVKPYPIIDHEIDVTD